MIRLIAVQGPIQLLNVISVLRFQEATEGHQDCQDILVIGGLYTASHSPALKNLLETCLQISKVWHFKARFTLLELEQLFEAGAIDFTTTVEIFKKQLLIHGISTVQVIYTCRNWQLFNEIILSAYPNAQKICYGDGLGFIDLASTTEISSSINPKGFVAIDDAYLITPVEVYKNTLSECKPHWVEPTFFRSIVKDSIQYLDQFRDNCLSLPQSQQGLTLVLTTNGTESGIYKDLTTEIESYLRIALKYTELGEDILVKGHPRETHHQAGLLTALLRKSGRNAFLVPDSECIPIELFTPLVPIKKALTLHSSSCTGLAYLCQGALESIIIGLGQTAINTDVNSSYQDLIYYEEVNAILTQQAYDQKFMPISISNIKEYLDVSKNFNQEPIWFKNGQRISNLQADSVGSRETLSVLNLQEIQAFITELPKLDSTVYLEPEFQTIAANIELLKVQQDELAHLRQAWQQYELQSSTLQIHLNQAQAQLEMAQQQIKDLQAKVRSSNAKRSQLVAQLKETQAMVTAMESSKFWKLRQKWTKLKQILRFDRSEEMRPVSNRVDASQNLADANSEGSDHSRIKHSDPLIPQECGDLKRLSVPHPTSIIQSPLTGSSQVTLLKTIDTQPYIQDWQDSFQIDITEELHNHDKIYLYQCDRTQLKFFVPTEIVGSENLYKQLEKFDWYYMPDKWEYQVALKDLKSCSTILEVGSGRGSFVRLGVQQGLDVRGLELNSEAVAIAQTEGLAVEQLDLETVAIQRPASFDAVCSFQVLEHVSHPKEFIQACIQLLKPKGKLIFCVPNAESFLKHQYCLLDMPPHHMGQWSEASFRALEPLFPIHLEKICYEPLASYHVLGYLHTYSEHFRAHSPWGKLIFNPRTLPLFEKSLNLGVRHFLKGQSLYVQFCKR